MHFVANRCTSNSCTFCRQIHHFARIEGVQVNFGNAKILIAPVLEIRLSEETLPATVSSVVWPSEKYQVNRDLYFHQKHPILGNCSQLILQQLQGPSQELDEDQHFLCKHEQTDHRRQN